MIKKNIKLTLHNNIQVYTNIAIGETLTERSICHFLGSLRDAKSVTEQIDIINNLTHCRGFSPLADEVIYYNTNNDYAEVRKCVYYADRNIYSNNKLVKVMSLNEREINC